MSSLSPAAVVVLTLVVSLAGATNSTVKLWPECGFDAAGHDLYGFSEECGSSGSVNSCNATYTMCKASVADAECGVLLGRCVREYVACVNELAIFVGSSDPLCPGLLRLRTAIIAVAAGEPYADSALERSCFQELCNSATVECNNNTEPWNGAAVCMEPQSATTVAPLSTMTYDPSEPSTTDSSVTSAPTTPSDTPVQTQMPTPVPETPLPPATAPPTSLPQPSPPPPTTIPQSSTPNEIPSVVVTPAPVPETSAPPATSPLLPAPSTESPPIVPTTTAATTATPASTPAPMSAPSSSAVTAETSSSQTTADTAQPQPTTTVIVITPQPPSSPLTPVPANVEYHFLLDRLDDSESISVVRSAVAAEVQASSTADLVLTELKGGTLRLSFVGSSAAVLSSRMLSLQDNPSALARMGLASVTAVSSPVPSTPTPHESTKPAPAAGSGDEESSSMMFVIIGAIGGLLVIGGGGFAAYRIAKKPSQKPHANGHVESADELRVTVDESRKGSLLSVPIQDTSQRPSISIDTSQRPSISIDNSQRPSISMDQELGISLPVTESRRGSHTLPESPKNKTDDMDIDMTIL